MCKKTVVTLLAASLVCSAIRGYAEEKVLFDFESAAQVKAWAMAPPPAPRRGRQPKPEPEARLEPATPPGGTGGALKLTYAGGVLPTVATAQVPEDFSPYGALKLDVTVPRAMLIGLRIMQEKGSVGYRGGWWETTTFLTRGANALSFTLKKPHRYRTRPYSSEKCGKAVGLAFYVYSPLAGEAVYLDNIRVTTEDDPKALNTTTPNLRPKGGYRVLGTDLTVSGVEELGRKLADRWVKPEKHKTIEEREAEFEALYAQLKAAHPNAVMVTFRQGQKGYDAKAPEKPYTGWSNIYITAHGPDGLAGRAATGMGERLELFMRHRSQLMRIDVSSIPKGAKILAAKLLLVASRAELAAKPNMYVAEACNRPWVEGEASSYTYAKGKTWKNVSGQYYDGDDPDYLPLYLAYGPGQGKTSVWDFTEGVKWWTEGGHANHGFFLHGEPAWSARTFTPRSKDEKNRPALIVIYEP